MTPTLADDQTSGKGSCYLTGDGHGDDLAGVGWCRDLTGRGRGDRAREGTDGVAADGCHDLEEERYRDLVGKCLHDLTEEGCHDLGREG